MGQKDQIMDLVRRKNGQIKTKDVVDQKLRKEVLSRLVEEGALIRVKRGVYMLPEGTVDELQIIQLKIPDGIFSFGTALYFNGLSNRVPEIYHISVPHGKNMTRIKRENSNIVLHYPKQEYFELGKKMAQTSFGAPIFIYDAERSILDLIKYRKKMDMQLFNDALKLYFESEEKNLLRLSIYAQKLGMENTLRVYTEVLL